MTDLSPMSALNEWLAELQTKEGLQHCADRAIAVIDAGLSLRVPKTEQERQNAFAQWLDGYRAKIGLEIQKQFEIEFPDLSKRLSKDLLKSIVDKEVWPQIEVDVRLRFEQKLIPYAVLSQAIAWGRKNIGDAGRYGQPQSDGCFWRVALSVAGYGDDLGCITLDMDGNIILEQTTTRQELLKHLHDYSAVSAATANA